MNGRGRVGGGLKVIKAIIFDTPLLDHLARSAGERPATAAGLPIREDSMKN